MDNQEIKIIRNLYYLWTGNEPLSVELLPASGSYRKYFRIKEVSNSILAVFNDDDKENIAFCSFTKHFLSKHLNVPNLLHECLDQKVYFIEDLGNTTLLSYLQDNNIDKEITTEIKNVYIKAIENLPLFQITGHDGFDYSKCYPRQSFDKQSMMWDLNYFKYYFLKLNKIPFNEQELEDDYNIMCNYLHTAPSDFFLYRDFQSRNIMLISNTKPYFIDYQGGRKGALQYDIASLLFESKTALPSWFREEMLDYYMTSLGRITKINATEFIEYYYGFVYIRLMQSMGAYGFRGLYEKKELFLQSIPPAMNHLEWLLNNVTLKFKLPTLHKIWELIIQSDNIKELAKESLKLTVNINSFSYRRGIPTDNSNNGGGFVFDCRSLNNPGRYDQYRHMTGKDPEVIDFLEKDEMVKLFISDVFNIINRSVINYKERKLKNLMINFGCTGGQHRSVFFAEKLNQYLKEKHPDIILNLRHIEEEMKI